MNEPEASDDRAKIARWATFAVLGLIVAMFVFMARIPGYVALWQNPNPELFETTRRSAGAELIWTAALTLTGIAFICWQLNCHRRVADKVRLRHWWAWLGWLIPILNFLMPYIYLKETYEAAAERADQPTQFWLGLGWWLSFVAWLVVNSSHYAALAAVDEAAARGAFPAYESAATTGLMSCLLGGLAAGLAITVVRRITQLLLSQPQLRVNDAPSEGG